MKKRSRKWYNATQFQQALRLGGALFFVLVFVLASFVNPSTQTVTPAPDIAQLTPTVLSQLPTVPPGGTPVVMAGTYFHPTGLFSIAQIAGWEKPADEPEEIRLPTSGSELSRAGVTFINSPVGSVIHTFAEKDPARKLTSVQDLEAFYTPEILKDAWSRYNAWKETGRQVINDWQVISFDLTFSSLNYLGQQLSRVNGDWLFVARIVAPVNNPELLTRLQETVVKSFAFWPQSLVAPLDWYTIVDSGYAVRYPPSWRRVEGSPGQPYLVTGNNGSNSVNLSTRAFADTLIANAEAARTWVQTQRPRATIQSVTEDARGDVKGYAVSFIDRDGDGNQRSSVAVLLNGPNKALLSMTLQVNAGGLNLLDPTAPAELTQVRQTFFALPAGISTTPVATPTPVG